MAQINEWLQYLARINILAHSVELPSSNPLQPQLDLTPFVRGVHAVENGHGSMAWHTNDRPGKITDPAPTGLWLNISRRDLHASWCRWSSPFGLPFGLLFSSVSSTSCFVYLLPIVRRQRPRRRPRRRRKRYHLFEVSELVLETPRPTTSRRNL
jgi:hypothetical protein